MKSLLTPNLLKFTLTAVLLTLVFRFCLSTGIENNSGLLICLSAILYAMTMWFNGRYFGIKEYKDLPIYDFGIRFHLATFLAHNLVSLLWFYIGTPAKYESIRYVYITIIIWLVFPAIHFVYFLFNRKDTIKNLSKDDLFE